MAALPSVRGTQARAAVTPLAGATVNLGAYGVSSYTEAANIFDGYIGLPMAKTFEKIYMGHGSFPAQLPPKMTQLAPSGCQFLVSVEPTKLMTLTDQKRMAKWLAMLNNSGLSYRVVLYTECNNKAFKTQQEWQAYWSYYAPVIQGAGVTCGYNPGCGFPAIPRALTYFPSNPAPDELWMDYYASGFRAGSRIDKLIGIAQAAGIPAGIAEWGWAAGTVVFNPMVMPWWNEYGSYLTNLISVRSITLGAMYFGSEGNGRKTNVIGSASDPRIPVIKQVAQAVAAS